ncbi:sphingosine N-acyltransferase lag1 [Apophysomyces ossiformis]|uniref:Sphingosine N-acyltransferase lag1 n=1 Tax=Apophysomyces ossiformis TaxID=679940 RepID=A0A8H7EP65_9FUNG|nr:sphingosine N-acyltransferase lag1 [Apophysomyces ossiformis]
MAVLVPDPVKRKPSQHQPSQTLLRRVLSSELVVSYKDGPDAYGKGIHDVYYVAYWVVGFTFLRAVIMKYIYHPLAKSIGVIPFAKRQRLAEQGFTFTYYIIFWVLGMYIMYHGPHWFNTSQYWIDYPHVLITKMMKTYYLMQMAFWFQQLYVIHVEKRLEPSKYLDMKWEPEKGKYFTPITQKMYLGLFMFLNVIMIYWFSMIVKVIVAVLSGNSAEDTRSDEEDEADVDAKQLKKIKDRGKQE